MGNDEPTPLVVEAREGLGERYKAPQHGRSPGAPGPA
jgi:hypothetical protein